MLIYNKKMKNLLNLLIVSSSISFICHTMEEEVVEYSKKTRETNEEAVKQTNGTPFKIDSNCTSPVNSCLESLYETIEEKNVDLGFHGSLRVDLHGQSESDARNTVIRLIQQAQLMEEDGKPISIHFISGRGNHINRKGNRGIIFKKLPTWLQDEKIAHLIDKHYQTTGAYEVFLKPCQFKDFENTTCKVLKLSVIQQLAELGEAQAQYLLGEMYIKGDRVKRDDKLGVQWLRKSAIQGLKEAQFELGYMCAMGMGTQYNPQEALKWYEKAGDQDHSNALLNIGTMHYVGEGIPQNFKKALTYYLKSASFNNLKAMNLLGICYRKIGNEIEGVKWDRIAAEKGEPHAKVNLAVALLEGRVVERNQIEGIKWLREAAEYGIVEGQMRLGMVYEHESGVPQDYMEALKWYLTAGLKDAGKPSSDAQWHLWRLYSEGKGVKQNEAIANRWLIRSADNGHSIAQLELGRHYKVGHCGFKRDVNQALKYFLLSANQGNAGAQYDLFEMYMWGWDNALKQDTKKANHWIRKAAENGHPMALILCSSTVSEELSESG